MNTLLLKCGLILIQIILGLTIIFFSVKTFMVILENRQIKRDIAQIEREILEIKCRTVELQRIGSRKVEE